MNGFDWSRYAVGGAAARPDSFSGLNQDYAAALARMIQAAEQANINLRITSAYRSPAVQAQIIARDMGKYGFSGSDIAAWNADVAAMGPEAAGQKWASRLSSSGLRKFVALPGRSKHQKGMAADIADMRGKALRDPNGPEARWIAQNAAQFGLSVPMSWEPWHVELAGARGGAAMPSGGAGATMPAQAGMPMMPGQMSGQQAADPFAKMGLLSKIAASRGIAQSAEAAPIANLLNILTQKRDPALAQMAKARGGLFGILGA